MSDLEGQNSQTAVDLHATRRRFLRTVCGIGTVAGVNMLLAACGGASAPSAPAATTAPAEEGAPAAAVGAAGGTLVFAAEEVSDSIEPGLWNGFGITNVIDNIYDKLTRPGENWGDPPRPALAESWEISDDGLTYTFQIRQGVKFHDGSDLTSEAVVRSLTRVINPDEPSYVEGMYMNAEFGQANWEGITAEGDYTVRLVLQTPDAAQLYRLFHPAAAIISAQAMDEFGPNVGTNPVGAGPFRLDRFTPGQEARLVAFDDYWNGRPAIDTVVIRGYPDEAAMVAALEAGEVNFAPYPPASAIQRLQNDPRFTVEPGPPLVSLFLGLNQLQEPMDNRDVRMAINYAINRQNLIDGVLYGLGELPATLISPVEFGFDPSGREISTQNLDLAREHIERSGLPTPIELTFSFENNRFWPQMAELIRSDLEAVGFSITMDMLEAGAYSNKVFSGNTQINMTQRSLWVPDPDNKVRLLHSSQGSAQFETGVAGTPWGDEMDALIDAGRSETDEARRLEIYRTIQQKMLEEMPYVMLAYYTKPFVAAANVTVAPPSAVSSERIFLSGISIG